MEANINFPSVPISEVSGDWFGLISGPDGESLDGPFLIFDRTNEEFVVRAFHLCAKYQVTFASSIMVVPLMMMGAEFKVPGQDYGITT